MPTALERLGAEIAAKADALAKLIDSHPDEMPADVLANVKTATDELDTLKGQHAEAKAAADLVAKARADAVATSAELKKTVRTIPHPGSRVVETQHVEAGESEHEKFLDRGPFKGLTHFLSAVKSGGDRPANAGGMLGEWREGVLRSDNATKAMFGELGIKASGMNEFADSEGGVLVPTQMAAAIWKRSLEDDFNFLTLPGLSTIPLTGNAIKIRARNDKSRASGSRAGGVLGYWVSEGGEITSSKPTYRTIDLRLNKLAVLIYATEELLEDTSAAEADMTDAAAGELRFMLNDAFINGDGQGKPLGVMAAPCKVVVTTAAGSNTITAANVDDMWARRARPSGAGYTWLGNQAIEGQLAQLNYAVANASATHAYTPGEAFNGQGLPRLKGKPVYYNEQCADLGTEGDLILLDPAQYAVAVKAGGIKGAVSMHVRFVYDESAFKWTVRVDGRPYWETSLTRFKGSNALSPIVTLESTRT
jgi:HK97 family phage major capsid protein